METRRFFKDGVLTSEDTTEAIGGYIESIGDCVVAGFDILRKFRDTNPENYAQLSTTTCACIVHDGMVAHAAEVFKGQRPDVEVVEALGSKIIIFSDRIALRFKKLSLKLEPRNLPTKQQEEFNQHTIWPDHTNLTAGYRLDATGHEIRDIHIVCWYYGELLWHLEVPYKREDQADDQDGPTDGARVTAKRFPLERTGTGQD